MGLDDVIGSLKTVTLEPSYRENKAKDDEEPIRFKFSEWPAYRRWEKANGDASAIERRDRNHIEDCQYNVDENAVDEILSGPVERWLRKIACEMEQQR